MEKETGKQSSSVDVNARSLHAQQYLESVFTVGRRWGRGKPHLTALWSSADIVVVLLDEADVFLEQRGISSLERNALVSGGCNTLTAGSES